MNDKEQEAKDNKESALMNVQFIQTCLRMGFTLEQVKAVMLASSKEQSENE